MPDQSESSNDLLGMMNPQSTQPSYNTQFNPYQNTSLGIRTQPSAPPQTQAQAPQEDQDSGSLLKGLSGLLGNNKDTGGVGVNPGYSPQSSSDSLANILGNANSQVGQDASSKVLQSYLQKANPGLDPKTTPWCAGFVGSVLNASGMKGTGSLAARSYLNYGQPTDKPTPGDIVVLSRGNDQSLGHVGFYTGQDRAGNPLVLGGNQGNGVSVKAFSKDQVLGYRVPPTGQQVQQIAQQNKIQNPQQLASLTKFSADNDPQTSQIMKGIAHVESSDSSHPYREVSIPSHGGDRAYGKYQIMGSNIPSWTKAATGHAMTPQQFLNDPQAQEQTAAYQIKQISKQYKNPDDVASVWFSGRSKAKAGNARDGYGTTVPQYIKKFREALNVSQNNVEQPKEIPINQQNPPNIPVRKDGQDPRDIFDSGKDYSSNISNMFNNIG